MCYLITDTTNRILNNRSTSKELGKRHRLKKHFTLWIGNFTVNLLFASLMGMKSIELFTCTVYIKFALCLQFFFENETMKMNNS